MANRDFQIRMGMEAEVSDAERALRDAQREVKRLGTEIKKVNADLAKGAGSVGAPLASTSQAMQRTAKSSKELAFATRNLPAQFTDIAVALQAGQNPLTVLLQQGGQLKDMFGGVGPAARAFGGYIRGLINPLTAAAAAVIGLTVAWRSAVSEMESFDRALIFSGNTAGLTADQLREMASALDDSTSGTERQAASVLARVAATGQFTADQMRQVAAAAIELENAKQQEVDETIKQFVRLAEDPVDAVLELNDANRFLTQSVIDQIRELDRQGKQAEAAELAISAYADTAVQRADELDGRLGLLSGTWRSMGSAAAEAWDGIISGFREADSAAADNIQRLRETIPLLDRISKYAKYIPITGRLADSVLGGDGKPDFSNVRGGSDGVVDSDAVREQIEAEKKAAEERKRWEEEGLRYASKREQLEQSILKMRADALDLGVSEARVREREAAMRADFAAQEAKRNRQPKGRKGTDPDAAAERALANLERERALLLAVAEGEERASEEARVRHEINEGLYKTANAALKQQLVDQAKLLDQDRARNALAKELESADLEILRMQGQGVSAALQQAIEKWDELEARASKVGGEEGAQGVRLAQQGRALSQMRAELQQLEQAFQQVMAEVDAGQNRLQTQLQAGLITEVDAQRQLVDMYREKGAVIEGLVPRMQELAIAIGDPQALANVQRIREELQQMQATTSLLQQQLGSTFQSSFANFLETLATGTESLREAVSGFLRDIASGLARMASQALAQSAWASIIKIFNKGAGSDVGEGAGKLQAAAVTTLGAGAAVSFGARQLSDAATQLASAATLMIVANSMGTGFAGGGYTGPGGKYQLAGYVHKDEGVLNKEEIRRLGGPRGFYALRDAIATGAWSRFAGAQTPHVSVPARPSYSFADGGYAANGMPAPVLNLRNLILFDIEDIAQRVGRTPGFRDNVVRVAGEEGRAIRGQWD